MEDGGTKRLTASEREALVRMAVANEILGMMTEELKQRAKLVPYAKRDMAMIRAQMTKLMEGFIRTIPLDQIKTYANNLKMVSYCVGVKRPGETGKRNDHDYGMWLPFETINRLFDGCHDKCLTCMLDKGQRKMCELRKALDSIPNDVQKDNDDCPYYSVI